MLNYIEYKDVNKNYFLKTSILIIKTQKKEVQYLSLQNSYTIKNKSKRGKSLVNKIKSHHWQSSLVGLISFFFFVFFNLMSFSFLLTTYLYFACIDLFSFWLPSLLWVSFQMGSFHRLPHYLFITLLLHTLQASHSPPYSPPNFLKQTFHKKRYTCIWLLFCLILSLGSELQAGKNDVLFCFVSRALVLNNTSSVNA